MMSRENNLMNARLPNALTIYGYKNYALGAMIFLYRQGGLVNDNKTILIWDKNAQK